MKPGPKKIEITQEILDKAEKAASTGLGKHDIARCLGFSWSTLNRRVNECEEFGLAIKRGHSKAIKLVTNALFENALSGNVTAQIFYLKNRAHSDWKDRIPEGYNETTKLPAKIEVEIKSANPDTSAS